MGPWYATCSSRYTIKYFCELLNVYLHNALGGDDPNQHFFYYQNLQKEKSNTKYKKWTTYGGFQSP